jgi:iron(III) transport system ATP-binding protein
MFLSLDTVSVRYGAKRKAAPPTPASREAQASRHAHDVLTGWAPSTFEDVSQFGGQAHINTARDPVSEVTLALRGGEIGVLIGPSGCGKTSLLRAVAGLERCASGRVSIAGQALSNPAAGVHVSAERRKIGMVFQDYALFPHLSVADNVAFGVSHLPPPSRKERVRQMLDLVGLGHASNRAPHQLSGGQQQRVALARALAPQPRLLLLDEPFSSLDADLRERLAEEVRRILRTCGATALLVTHDQLEAFAVGDVIGVMNQGRLEQWADAYTLYHRPASRFVAQFIGHGVFTPATYVMTPHGPRLRTPLGDVVDDTLKVTWEVLTTVPAPGAAPSAPVPAPIPAPVPAKAAPPKPELAAATAATQTPADLNAALKAMAQARRAAQAAGVAPVPVAPAAPKAGAASEQPSAQQMLDAILGLAPKASPAAPLAAPLAAPPAPVALPEPEPETVAFAEADLAPEPPAHPPAEAPPPAEPLSVITAWQVTQTPEIAPPERRRYRIDQMPYGNGECDVLLRADDIVHDDASAVRALIERKAFRGSEFLLTLRLSSGERVVAHVPSHHDHKVGEWIGIRAEIDHVVTFPRRRR